MRATQFTRELDSELHELYQILSNLSDAVNNSGCDWNDAKHEDLARSVRGIASASSSVMTSGSDFLDVYRKFLGLLEG